MRLNDRLRWLVIAIVIVAGTLAIFLPQSRQLLAIVLELVQSAGVWGPVLFIAIYVLACVLCVPGSILTIGAGVIFGIWIGTIAVSIGSTLGAGAAFLLARTLLRDWTARKVSANARFRALDEVVGKQGFKIVLLTRLSPVLPFNLLNFAYGITSVSLRDYMLASWIGMLPGAILYVYIGVAIKSLAELTAGKRPWSAAEQVLFGFGLVATAIVSIMLTRLAHGALKNAQTQPTDSVAAQTKKGISDVDRNTST